MSSTEIATQVIDTLTNLCCKPVWRELFSDVMLFASEKFLQASLVADFNATHSNTFIASYEYDKVDVAFTQRSNLNEWKKQALLGDQYDDPRDKVYGLLEIKTCHVITQHMPWHQYGPTSAASKVAGDIEKMRSKKKNLDNCKDLLELITISTYCPQTLPDEVKADPWTSEKGLGVAESITDAQNILWSKLLDVAVDWNPTLVGECWLLHGIPIPSEPDRRAYCKALLIRVDD